METIDRFDRKGKPMSNHSTRRRFGRAQDDHIRDPYQALRKPHEPAVCTGCGAFYHQGRWQWGRAPDGAHNEQCPACRRVADHLPAGMVTLPSDFVESRRVEIVGLLRNEENAEKGEHPLNRIIEIEHTSEAMVVHTTDIHLPHRLGNALKRAFHGELDMHFDENGYFARVDWHPPI